MTTCIDRKNCGPKTRSRLLFAVTLAGSLGTLLLLPAEGRPQGGMSNIVPADAKGKVGIEFVVPEGLKTPPRLILEAPFQQGNRCGPNALYILLRLLHKSVSYEELLAKLPTGEAGCSLEDLQRVGTEYGVRLDLRQLTPEELQTAPKPLIIHVRTPTASDGKTPTGHFTVVTGNEPGEYLLGVDTSNAQPTTFSPQYLARNFSGSVLVPDTARTWIWSHEGIFYLTVLIGVVLLNLGALWRLRPVSPPSVQPPRPQGQA